MSHGSETRDMRCPTCKREVPHPPADAPRGYFPFCSERCKLIDLGRWLDGKYQIPVTPDDESHDGDFTWVNDDDDRQSPR
jgi:uncharacterized protein